MADLDASIRDVDNTFSRYLPLPYRLSVLLVLGIWCWAGDIYVLAKKQIVRSDSSTCDRPHANKAPKDILQPIGYHHAGGVWRYASLLSSGLLVSFGSYLTVTRGAREDLVSKVEGFPILTLLVLLVVVFVLPQQWLVPRSWWPQQGRSRLRRTLKRISLRGLSKDEDEKASKTGTPSSCVRVICQNDRFNHWNPVGSWRCLLTWHQ
jgi:hypothetical protein